MPSLCNNRRIGVCDPLPILAKRLMEATSFRFPSQRIQDRCNLSIRLGFRLDPDLLQIGIDHAVGLTIVFPMNLLEYFPNRTFSPSKVDMDRAQNKQSQNDPKPHESGPNTTRYQAIHFD